MKSITFCDSKGDLMKPREYQFNTIKFLVENPRGLLLSPTSSGKSLILYTMIRWYQSLGKKKILLVVPTVTLVNQLYNDFDEYSFQDDWDVGENCHKISGSRPKNSDKEITISTWQGIFKQNKKYFSQFDCVLIDECHLADAKGLTSILEKSVNADVRIGCTGTLKEAKSHKLVMEGLFGPVFTSTTTKKMMDDGFASKLEIKCLLLGYNDEERKACTKANYASEIEYIVKNKRRNNFIKNLALRESKTGNILVLFNRKSHGEHLVDIISKHSDNVHLIYGKTHEDDRESIRKYTIKNTNNILVASYGVFSTGTNIPNLQSLIFAHPYKSEIKNLQSIGRVLRLDGITNKATLFDLADDLSWKTHQNYTLKHFNSRIELYNKQKFDYKIYSVKI